jgi:hypothetical protein
MAVAGLPVIRTVAMAYRDVWHAVRMMPRLVLISAVIVFALNLVEYTAVSQSVRDFPATVFISNIVINLMLTPLFIALYRYLLIAEVTTDYAIDFKAPRFVRFFAWSAALSSIWMISTVIDSVWPDDDPLSWAGWAVALLAYAIALVRLVVLFPAIAIDAPGATLSNSIADTKGHLLNILLIYLAASVPIALAAVLLVVLVAIVSVLMLGAATELDIPGWVFAALVTLLVLVPPALLVGIDARIFQTLADRVRQSST